MMKRFSQLCALGVTLSALSGCDTMSEMVTSNLPQSHTGPASLVVSLRAQEVYLYRGGHLTATSRISSGREGHRTPLGPPVTRHRGSSRHQMIRSRSAIATAWDRLLTPSLLTAS